MGLRSFLAFWLGGAASPVQAEAEPPNPGGHITAGGFSRKKWRALKELLAAQSSVEKRAEQAAGKEAAALQTAADGAADVIARASEAEQYHLDRMRRLLEAAAQAQTAMQCIQAANRAAAYAIKVGQEIEEEEEFLLLN